MNFNKIAACVLSLLLCMQMSTANAAKVKPTTVGKLIIVGNKARSTNISKPSAPITNKPIAGVKNRPSASATSKPTNANVVNDTNNAFYKSITIHGEAIAKKSQVVALIRTRNPHPKLTCTVEQIVDYYWQEAQDEGIRPDFALAQALLETGYFTYTSDVKPQQNNFCGLGAVGGGEAGVSFKTAQEGARAHIQHLLAYSTARTPRKPIIDPRYRVSHAIRMERGLVDKWVGLDGTWAMTKNYGEKIIDLQQRMLLMPISEDDNLAKAEAPAVKNDKHKKQHPKEATKEKSIQKLENVKKSAPKTENNNVASSSNTIVATTPKKTQRVEAVKEQPVNANRNDKREELNNTSIATSTLVMENGSVKKKRYHHILNG